MPNDVVRGTTRVLYCALVYYLYSGIGTSAFRTAS